MKKAQQGKAGAAANDVKPQETLLHFFQRQTQTSSSVEKVMCPGCNLQVPKSKINWHLDQDCKSRSGQKGGGNKSKSVKNRKLLKAIEDKKLKVREQAVLLDREDDAEDLSVLDLKENENPGNSDSDPDIIYITPSMVETQLFETEDDLRGSNDESVVPSQTDGDGQTTSPCFSLDGKKTKNTPMKRHERVIDFALPKSNPKVAFPVSDWDSLQVTPEKDQKSLGVNVPLCKPYYTSTYSPQTKSGKEVKTMLEEDWSYGSPGTTPKKKESPENDKKANDLWSSSCAPRTNSESEDDFQKTQPMSKPKILTPKKCMYSLPVLTEQEKSCVLSSEESELQEGSGSDFEKTTVVMRTQKKSPKKNMKSVSPKFIGQGENFFLPDKELQTGSDDDFEKSNIVYKTPNKHSPSDRLKSVSPRSFKSMKGSNQDKMKDVSLLPENKLSDEQESALYILRSPETSSKSNTLDNETESLILFSSIESGEDLATSTSPSILAGSIDTDESLNPVRQLFTESPTKSDQVSPRSSENSKRKVNVSSEVRINVKKFANVAKTSSDQDDIFESLLQTSSQNSRSPWKVRQGLRRTGLLQNSSQYLSATMTMKKQTTTSPLSSPSNTPVKSGIGESSSSGNTEGSQQKYDRAIFRQSKGYYLENFLRILDTVLSQPQDVKLLNDDDQEAISTFQGLSLSAQKLYVRLFQRKIKWNRTSKIEYRDICDPEDTELYVNELGYANFLHQESEMDSLEEVLPLLSCGELQGLCRQMKIPATGRKDAVVRTLIKFAKQQTTIISAFSKGSAGKSVILVRAKESLGHCCILNKSVRQVFVRVLMLYGIPRYDDDEEGGQQSHLTTLLMVNMGKMKFPHFDIIRNHSIFRTRDDLIRYETCSQILADVQECMEGKMWDAALQHCALAKTVYQDLHKDKELMDHDRSLPRFLRHYTSASLLMYILTCSVECYQRIKRYQKAVNQLKELLDQDTYLLDYHGRWYDRLALNLEMHLKKPALAVEAIGKALKDPEVRKGHRLSLSIRAERMAASARHKKLAPIIAEMPLMIPKEAPKVIIEGRTIHADIPGYKRLFIRQDSDRHAGEGEVTVCSVEELALRHYKEQGYSEGLHREGTTINTLFALYFWDALYAPVSDVFRSPHQAAPLDLDDKNFYTARKELIDNRLSELRNWSEAAAEAELERVWNDHAGELSLASWDLFHSRDHAKGLVTSMGLPVLAAICERLAKDHRFTRSGFPDLIVWNPDTKRCRIVEVKGPNDRLSTKQILWLDYLLTNGAAAEVCHVEAIGAKKMTRASPRKILPRKVSTKKSNNGDVADLGDTEEEPNKRKTRQNKKRPESDKLVKEKKSKKSRFKEKGKKIADSDSSSEENISSREISDNFEEPKKKITENDSSIEVRKFKRKNSNNNENGKKGRKTDNLVPERNLRKKKNDDFEEQTINKKRKMKPK